MAVHGYRKKGLIAKNTLIAIQRARSVEGMTPEQAGQRIAEVAREYGATFIVAELSKRFRRSDLTRAWRRIFKS